MSYALSKMQLDCCYNFQHGVLIFVAVLGYGSGEETLAGALLPEAISHVNPSLTVKFNTVSPAHVWS